MHSNSELIKEVQVLIVEQCHLIFNPCLTAACTVGAFTKIVNIVWGLSVGSFLTDTDVLFQSFNVRYASVVDNLLAESLSSYEKTYDGTVQRRSNAVR